MIIPEDLKKLISNGDNVFIAELYAEKHSGGSNPDYRTVTRQYVDLILKGERPATPGTAAEEIMEIAIKYLEHKRDFIEGVLI